MYYSVQVSFFLNSVCPLVRAAAAEILPLLLECEKIKGNFPIYTRFLQPCMGVHVHMWEVFACECNPPSYTFSHVD